MSNIKKSKEIIIIVILAALLTLVILSNKTVAWVRWRRNEQ